MSKLIKAEQYIEALPCRLKPIDMDAFFVNESETEFETNLFGNETHPKAAGEKTEDQTATGNGEKPEKNPDPKEVDPERLAFVVERISSLLNGTGTTEGAAKASQPEQDESWITGARQEAESIFSNAKQHAGQLTEAAKKNAEKLFSETKHQAESEFERAKLKAKDLASDASLEADTIFSAAKRQAHLVVEEAGQQAGKIIAEAKQQAEDLLAEGNRQVTEITENANQEAQKAIEAAQLQAVEIQEQARSAGHQTGYQEGLDKAQQETREQLAAALALVAQAEVERTERIISSEPELLKLAVAIAEKIIGQELKFDPSRQLEIAREALAQTPNVQSITIRVHPDDYQTVSENSSILQAAFNEPKPVHFEEDPSIMTGSCFIETNHGNIDSRIKSQLEKILMELLKVGNSNVC